MKLYKWGDDLPAFVFIQPDGALVGTDDADVTPDQAAEWYASSHASFAASGDLSSEPAN